MALAFDHDDCGIDTVSTAEPFRRRGLGAALTAPSHTTRGSARATLQSSLMAEGVYAEAGFRSLGRILEYVPPEG